MASDVLVSDTVAGSATNEFDIMTSSANGNGEEQVVVDLMASPNGNGTGTSASSEAASEPEIVPVEVAPAKLLKMGLVGESNGNGDADSPEPEQQNGHCNGNGGEENGGHSNGNGHHNGGEENGHHHETEETNGHSHEEEEVVVAEEEGKHTETVVVKTEEETTPEGEVINTTTTTVVKVDESADGESTQITTTTVKTTTVSYHESELVVEVGANSDQPPVEAHELAAIVEEKEEAAATEKSAAASPEKQPTEAAATAATKEQKQSTARRLFNFVRSPAKQQKSVDDPTQVAAAADKEKDKEAAAAEAKAKSPSHQRRLFGWRKTWTPEKGESTEEGADEEKSKKKAKKSKKEEATQEGAATDENAAASAAEEKVVSPKKKLRLGLGMKKSKSTTNSPAKPEKAASSAADKWANEKCAESEHTHQQQQPAAEEEAKQTAAAATEEKPVDVEAVVVVESEKKEETEAPKAEESEHNLSATEKWVAESCTERPATPLKEEAKKAEESVAKSEEPAATEAKKQKKEKQPSVRKSWTFRMNRSHTEAEKMAAANNNKASTMSGTTKEAPPALHPAEKSATFSPGKPFFSGLLHRKKNQQREAPTTPLKADNSATEQPQEVLETSITVTAESKVAESMSMPHLTPEKSAHNQSASEKWAAEGCGEQPEAAHEEKPQSQSTAIKKSSELEGSPMRRSASLRMPSSLSRFFRFLGPRHRTTTVSGALGEEGTPERSGAVTPPASSGPSNAPHTTSLTTPASPTRNAQTLDAPSTDSKSNVTQTPGRSGFRFWSTWRSSGGAGTFGRFRRKDAKNATIDGGATSHDDTSLIVNTSLGAPQKSATLHDMPRGQDGAPSVDLGAILARLPPHSPNDHSPTYIGISRVLNGYAEYNSPTKRSGASSQASHKSPGGTVTATLDVPEPAVVNGVEGGSLLAVCSSSSAAATGEIGRDAHACLATADAEQARLEGRCAGVRSYLDAPELTAEARGQIEATLGKTNLLLTQKFKQFRDLCHEATKPAVEGHTPPPNATDLAGFWDLVLIQVHDLDSGFDAIELMKQNAWQKPAAADAINGTESADSKKQKKKKQDKSKAKKSESESDSSAADAKAKSRFAEFKQRMFKGGKEKSVEKEPAATNGNGEAAAATNGSSNGHSNGEASNNATVAISVAVEEAK